MSKMETRKGYVRFLRLGPNEFSKQKGIDHCPERTGMWAFPYPYFDEYFANHRYNSHMPKNVLNGDYDDQVKWLKKNKHSVERKSSFWYKGDIYGHISPQGEIGTSSMFYHHEDPDWFLMDAGRFKELADKSLPDTYQSDSRNPEFKFKSSIDYLEVFIPRGRGKILQSAP